MKCKDCGGDIEVPKDGRCDECIKLVYTMPERSSEDGTVDSSVAVSDE